ncbi:hypothetical protein C8D92_102230 [Tamilnaduibacter salinus]|uniref:Uncharacterized protein n=1 Tax=Tamilnaduibacter salinus TaxID=1484056 RepID=A0A2U1CZH3_9GAMM|nr:hypothetical protein [Tamilnaduibacter salinus]PVY78190.1 hypothetical protein C8D92_102230 [Tamilnaduibacter salinus]
MIDQEKAPEGANQTGAQTSTTAKKNTPQIRPLASRHARILKALLNGPQTREQIDRAGPVSNGPAYIADLRQRGLNILCCRRRFTNADGQVCRPGIYFIDESSRPLALSLLRASLAG